MKSVKFLLIIFILAVCLLIGNNKIVKAGCCGCIIGYGCCGNNCGVDTDPDPSGGGTSLPHPGGSEKNGFEWRTFLDQTPFQPSTGTGFNPGTPDDQICPNALAGKNVNVIHFTAQPVYDGDRHSWSCDDSYFSTETEGACGDVVSTNQENALTKSCNYLANIVSTPDATNYQFPFFYTVDNNFTLNLHYYNQFGGDSNRFCGNITTFAQAKAEPSVTPEVILWPYFAIPEFHSGNWHDYGGDQITYYNFTAPEEGWYTFAVFGDSSPSVRDYNGIDYSWIALPDENWKRIYSLHLDDGETKRLAIYARTRTVNRGDVAYNVRLTSYRDCNATADGILYRKPENISSGNPADKPTFYTPLIGRYTYNWIFKPNFSGNATVRVFNRQQYESFTIQKKADDGSWVDEPSFNLVPWYGDGPDYLYFTMNAQSGAEYQLNIQGWGGGNFFNFLIGFDPQSIKNNLIWRWYLPLIKPLPDKGTISGLVYNNTDSQCSGTTPNSSIGDWSVTCQQQTPTVGTTYTARQDSVSSYTCLDNGSDQLTAGNTYKVTLTALNNLIPNTCSLTTQIVSVGNSAATIYLGQAKEAWFQTDGGDVAAANGRISDKYPIGSYLALNTASSQPGVVIYNSSTSPYFGLENSGNGKVSETDWQAKSLISPKGISYDSLKSLAGDPEVNNFPTDFSSSSKLSSLSGATDNIYFRDSVNGDLTIGVGDTVSSDQKLVVIVDANVHINKNITVEKGGFLAIIASGDITIDSSVTQLEGVYVTNGTFTVSASSTPPDVQFVGNGIFTANQYNLARDLVIGNATLPAEKFTLRPDLILNAPSVLWQSAQTWQEVAP